MAENLLLVDFLSQQFKRSCLPDGPKVGSVAVSPRGDLRMPSDASARIWQDVLEKIRNLNVDRQSGELKCSPSFLLHP